MKASRGNFAKQSNALGKDNLTRSFRSSASNLPIGAANTTTKRFCEFFGRVAQSFKMADRVTPRGVSTTHLEVSLTMEEFGQARLMRLFRLVGPLLGRLVQRVLKDMYGEEEWRRKAGDGLSKEMYSRLEKTRKQSLKDVFLITELLLHNLEVFSGSFDRDGSEASVSLSTLALAADRVSLTRTCVFHGVRLSTENVRDCVHSLEKIWRGFPQLAASGPSVVDELRSCREVRQLSIILIR